MSCVVYGYRESIIFFGLNTLSCKLADWKSLKVGCSDGNPLGVVGFHGFIETSLEACLPCVVYGYRESKPSIVSRRFSACIRKGKFVTIFDVYVIEPEVIYRVGRVVYEYFVCIINKERMSVSFYIKHGSALFQK